MKIKNTEQNGNVQPQYAAQRSIVGCTVLGESFFLYQI